MNGPRSADAWIEVVVFTLVLGGGLLAILAQAHCPLGHHSGWCR